MNLAEIANINAEKFSQKPALGFRKKEEWKEISWLQLRNIVFKTANALKNAGISEGDRVAIYSENSAEWVCMDLAILSLGAITVPIYATNNLEQAEYILNDSEAKIILAGNQEQYDFSREILRKSKFLTLVIAAKKLIWKKDENSVYFEDFIEKSSENFNIIPKNPDDLATLIYTSGTTGVPKGVMLTHGNFIRAFEAHFEFFRFKNFEKEHSLAFLPLTHVFERSWTLLCLYGGAKVTLLENPKLIASALAEVKPTMMCAVPRFYQKIYGGILETVKSGSATKQKIFSWAIKTGTKAVEYRRLGRNLPTFLSMQNTFANTLVFSKIKQKLGGKLWFLPCGGASVSPEITRFFDAMGLHIIVGYGLTETTATLTAFPVKNYIYGTAGTAMGDTQIKIDNNGEILVKGSGIMKGYYKKPEETAKVFTEEGFFRTGDAGVLDEHGNLTITDRIKDLMKTSNGKYIAPQPIENLLSDDHLIDQAMLVAEGRPYVTALIVPNFELLKEQLPKLGVNFSSWEEVVNLTQVKDLYHHKIAEIQKSASGFEKVKKFILMPSEFEISSGEITPTLKIKRNIVLEKYKDKIGEMYK